MMRFLLAASLIFLFGGCDSEPATELTGIEALMADYGHEHGVSVAVVDGGDIRLETYGYSDKDTGDPITESTVFQVASISKLVTAVAALRYVEDGRIELDKPINSYLTSWKVPQNEFTTEVSVTIRQLLSHTAGATVHGFGGYSAGEPVPTLVQVLDGASPANSPAIVIDKTPGGFFRYSGGGYCIIQQALIDIAGKSFPELMREVLLDPLAMDESTFEQPLPSSWTSKAAIAHADDGDAVTGLYHTYPEMAAAGFWTTPRDLAKLMIDLQGALAGESGRILTPEMAETMMTPIKGQYGLGVLPQSVNGARYFGHTGANSGYRASFFGHRSDKLGMVVLINGERENLLGALERHIADREEWPGY